MSGPTLNLRVDKDSFAGLHHMAKQLKDPKDMLREIGDVVVEDIKQRITTTKKDPNEVAWAPWAPSTAKARQRKGNAALGLLNDSGALLQSITHKLTSNNKLQVGTALHYAAYLNDGTPKMPARPFIGVSDRARQGINEVLRLYFGDK